MDGVIWLFVAVVCLSGAGYLRGIYLLVKRPKERTLSLSCDARYLVRRGDEHFITTAENLQVGDFALSFEGGPWQEILEVNKVDPASDRAAKELERLVGLE